MTELDAPFSSPESRAALECLKNVIIANIPSDMIAAAAFDLLGESQGVIDDDASELFEELQHQLPPFSRTEAFGLALALREVVRDRIMEIKGNAI
jgi:hypothetical protein